MADRKVNGQLLILVKFSLNSHRDTVARMIIGAGVEFSAFVKVGDVVPAEASFLARNGGCVTFFETIVEFFLAINPVIGKSMDRVKLSAGVFPFANCRLEQ